MISLALEFSSTVRSVAVARGSEAQSLTILAGATDEGARSAGPLVMIERALSEAQIEREAVGRIVVGLGPGSYTGIRSAIAVAQGWQLAREIPLVGISSAECLAAQAQARGWQGSIVVVIDAQRGELYVAHYEIGAKGCREIEPLRLASVEAVRDSIPQTANSNESIESSRSTARIIGPEATKWFPEGEISIPDARTLAVLGMAQRNFVSGEHLEPIYLRAVSFVKAPAPRIVP